MSTRQITGQIRDSHDQPLANELIQFTHAQGAYTATALYPRLTPVAVVTDGNGLLPSGFALVSGLNVAWRCTYANESFTFNFPDGGAISLMSLRAIGGTPQPAQTPLDAETAARTAADQSLQYQIDNLVVSGGGDKAYRHVQGSAASVWTVLHNLGKRVSVEAVDSSGDRVWGELHYDSNNQVTLTFTAAFGGEAYCN